MANARKLQCKRAACPSLSCMQVDVMLAVPLRACCCSAAEIERTMKKINEGLEVFDVIWDKVARAACRCAPRQTPPHVHRMKPCA